MARLNERDVLDISKMLPVANFSLLFALAEEILAGDLLPAAKTAFATNFAHCLEEADVPDYLQQSQELCQRFRQ